MNCSHLTGMSVLDKTRQGEVKYREDDWPLLPRGLGTLL